MRHNGPLSPNNGSARSVTFARESTRSLEVFNNSKHKRSNERAPKCEEIGDIIKGMNMAVTKSQRKNAVEYAVKKFNHRDKDQHNIELEMGAANALYQKLIVAFSSKEQGKNSYSEMGLICSALEMVYRCSSSARAKSFADIGVELVQLYLRVIKKCEASRVRKTDEMINDILSVFQYFSRVQQISIPLLNLPGVLSTLALVVSSNHLPDSTRATAMSTLADLACAEANGVIMARVPELFDSVLEVAHLDSSIATREAASRAIQNIVFSLESPTATIKFEKLIKTLIILLQDSNDNSRKYASGAMQNLTTWEGYQERLVDFDGGIVLDSLVRMIAVDYSAEARIRCLGAIVNLSSHQTVSTLCTHKKLLGTLANAASSDKNLMIKNNAADALCWLSEDMTSPRKGLNELLGAVTKVSRSGNANGVARGFYVLTQNTANRNFVAEYNGVLKLLEDIATKHNSETSNVAKEHAIKALSNLARR